MLMTLLRKSKKSIHVTHRKYMEKSANTDHQNIENHQIDCEGASIVEREQDWKMTKTKEAIHIRLQGAAMNWDQGAFKS